MSEMDDPGQGWRTKSVTPPGAKSAASRSAIEQPNMAIADTLELAIRHLGRGEPALARLLLERAVALVPRFPFALRILGDACRELGDVAAAEAAYRQALAIDPHVRGGEIGLGRLLLQADRLDEAAPVLARAVARNPDDWPHLCVLGEGFFAAGRPSDALLAYGAVREVAAEAAALALSNMGVCFRALGRDDEAIDAFKAAIDARTDFADAWENLVLVLHAHRRDAEAADIVARWIKAMPNDPVAQHLYASMGDGEAPDGASAAFVRTHFDRMALIFDKVLAELGYQTPNRLAAAVAGTLNPRPASLDVLDVGCGTGLAGQVLRPWARSLTGVDLSSRMIEGAQRRGLYDRLEVGEALAFLQSRPASFDLVVAADVVVYMGELGCWVDAVRTALRSGASVAFNVERHTLPDPWRLQSSGRYSHSPAAVQALLEDRGFEVRLHETSVIRRERNLPIEGALFVATRVE